MTNKKETIKKLVVFYILAVVLANAPMLLYFYISKSTDSREFMYSMVALFTMCAPAVANILTRLITKEGFSNMLIWGRLKGHVKYYVIAISFPVVYWIISYGIVSIIYGGFLEAEAIQVMGVGYFIKYAIYLIGFSMVMTLTPFGEELGWRGYMTPKLEEIFNTPITLLLGGSLWGIWHFSDSFLGAGCKLSGEFWFLLFNKCILCIAMGAVLTWLTKKTKTVITSSIAHAIFNNISGVMPIFFISEDSIKESDKMVLSAILLVPMIIFGVIAGVLISRDKKKELSE